LWEVLALVTFLGLGAAGYFGARALVVDPRCQAACATRGEAYVSLDPGRRTPTREGACVCSGGARVPTQGPDLMVLCGAVLGIGGLSAAARLAPGEPRRRRR
jgi:hypothetical protein